MSEYDIGAVPEGWRVLWCRDAGCLMSLVWTDDIIDDLADPDGWFDALRWAADQTQHGEHTGVAATPTTGPAPATPHTAEEE